MIAVLALSSVSYAAEWHQIASGQGSQKWVDRSSVTELSQEGIRKAWFKEIFAVPKKFGQFEGVRLQVALTYADCRTRKIHLQQSVLYDGAGDVVSQLILSKDDFRATIYFEPTPGSGGEIELDELCGARR